MRGSLFDRRFVIVAGKGGVGKSTVAAAFALSAARRGKRVLIAELGGKEKAASLFGRTEPVGYRVTRVYEGIDVINLTPNEALREYGLMKLKFERVYRAVFENPLMKSLTRMIPGMNELVLIGKTWHLEQERDASGNYRWDMIVVDAPATGQGVSLLVLPHVITETVRSGPMYEETALIRDMLVDSERTVMNIVSRPEEMPVNETLDLYRQMQDSLRIEPGLLLINGIWPTPPEPLKMAVLSDFQEREGGTDREFDSLLETTRFMVDRHRAQKPHLRTLRGMPMRQIEIPYLFRPAWDFAVIDSIATTIDRSLATGTPAGDRTQAT